MDIIGHNNPEFSVSEISLLLKRTVEQDFSNIRVRGEISGFKPAPSGHLYFNLKDSDAVLSAVCWRSKIAGLKIKPEDGIEVIAKGSMSIFQGQSKYQLVIDSLELAGEGALRQLLEKRKEQFLKEGLFDPAKRKPLPKFPKVIGVITSKTGSVIKDILHRISDRYPVRVLVWSCLVQGDGAKDQIAAAIDGFNKFTGEDRPDVLIVARGGGSIEDLWAFNEEIVIRATYNSLIPIISAVGHETDTTLIDFVSDVRAPTPTAAAEMAVPVRAELALFLDNELRKITNYTINNISRKNDSFEYLKSRLPDMLTKIEQINQKLDDSFYRIDSCFNSFFKHRIVSLENLASRLLSPEKYIELLEKDLSALVMRARTAINSSLTTNLANIENLSTRIISPEKAIEAKEKDLDSLVLRLKTSVNNNIKNLDLSIENLAKLLKNTGISAVLERGYSIIKRASDNKIISSINELENGEYIIQTKDGSKKVVITN